VSTPTFEGRSRIKQAYLGTDQQTYHVPCPFCGWKQELVWSQIKYTTIVNSSGKEEPEDVHYECISCKAKIEEYHKETMLPELGYGGQAEWVAKHPGVKGGKSAGFHLNSLYSPLGWEGAAWKTLVQQWLDAQGKPEELRGFINTVLGDTWKDRGDAPEWEILYQRREYYALNLVPPDVVFLTAGVDVQKDRLEYEIVGWCRNKRSYSINYGVIPGDTGLAEGEEGSPWNTLATLWSDIWVNAAGHSFTIRKMAVDTSYNTQHVYAWVRKQPQARALAVDGRDNLPMPIGTPKAVDVKQNGKRVRRGLKLWPIGVSHLKGELYSWLQMHPPTDEEVAAGKPYPFGYCHFPDYSAEYFKQMTSEQLVVRVVKGRKRYGWEKTRERNEALDCRIYARAAASAEGMDRWTDAQWLEQAGRVGISVGKAQEPVPPAPPPGTEPQPAPPPPQATAQPVVKKPRRRSSFLA